MMKKLLTLLLLSLSFSACGFLPLDEPAYVTYVKEKAAAERETRANTGYSGTVCSAVAGADGSLYFSVWREDGSNFIARWKDGAVKSLKSFDAAVFSMTRVDDDIFFTSGQALMRYDISAGTAQTISSFGYDTNGIYRLGDYLVVDTLPPSTCVVHVFRISDLQETQSFVDSDRGAGWFYHETSGRAYRIAGMGRSLGYRDFDPVTGTFGAGSVMGAQDADYIQYPWWLFPDGSRLVDHYGVLYSTTTLGRSGSIGIEHIEGMEFEGDKAIILENRYDLGMVGELEVRDASSPYSKLGSVRIFDYEPDFLVRGGSSFFTVLSDYMSKIYIYRYTIDEML
jgi:hypothetical protein